MPTPGYVTAPAEYNLPASFCREIGRIVVRWAHFESLIQQMIWDLLHLEPAYGRIAVRDPRMTDRINMLRDLATLRGVEIEPTTIKGIYDAAEELAPFRDLLAHGAWMRPKGIWMVEKVAGKYPKTPEYPKVSRRIDPEGVAMDLNELRAISDRISNLINQGNALYHVVHAQLPASR